MHECTNARMHRQHVHFMLVHSRSGAFLHSCILAFRYLSNEAVTLFFSVVTMRMADDQRW